MPVANRRRQRDRTAEHGIGLLVILHERFSLGRDGDHAVRGLTVRAELRLKWCGKLAFILRSQDTEEIRDGLIHDSTLTCQHARSAIVSGEDQQDRIVLPFECAREP